MRLPWLAHDEAPGPYITIPQYWFNKTKQHTQDSSTSLTTLTYFATLLQCGIKNKTFQASRRISLLSYDIWIGNTQIPILDTGNGVRILGQQMYSETQNVPGQSGLSLTQ